MTAGSSGLQSGEIDVASVHSPVIAGGPEDADVAVVFVHGNPGSSEDWRELAEEISAYGRVVALDMPGFGRADKPDDFDYTVGGYARHFAGALEQLGIRRAHLVLHDFGGPWGLAWAATHPDAFASVTLINTGLMPGYRWHYLARIWQTPALGELFMAATTRRGFRWTFKRGNPLGLPRAFVDRMYDDFDQGTRRAVLKLYRASRDVETGTRLLAAALRPLDLPALVVWGKHDPYLPVAYAERQREVFPKAKVVILDDSGHWPFADDPAGVMTAVVPFLRDQLAATARSAAASPEAMQSGMPTPR